MPTEHCFALLDGNNFYVSCERLFNPALLGRPVVVLSNNDGCIVSRSAEAKTIGIAMGVPFHEARDLLYRHRGKALSSNYELYGSLSRRMMTLAARYGSSQEIYSIDECFLDFSAQADPQQQARRLRLDVQRALGLPVSIGLGTSKTLAKLANQIAKQQLRFGGVFDWCMLDAAEQQQLLQTLDVGTVWGIGRRLRERLHALGIASVAQLAVANPVWMRQRFGLTVERTVRELQGEACLALADVNPPRQQIQNTRSFARRLDDLAELQAAISHHVARCAEKLRAQHSASRLLHVMLCADPPIRGGGLQHRHWASLPLLTPTTDSRLLTTHALQLLRQLYQPGMRYHKCGVILDELVSTEAPRQNDLFLPGESLRDRQLMQALDGINQRFGKDSIRMASSLLGNGRWQMRQEQRSPRCTTRWDELLSANT
ncbi:Y-family DNA polymerase [Vogesella oryzae]|uniref:Y-family DNA polymerase n=1 Tax=Vogesella oryzae TaxID=1735285 RepID=UPI0015817186|nr:Y-family DNA polymerase [Vogesella oryzae]